MARLGKSPGGSSAKNHGIKVKLAPFPHLSETIFLPMRNFLSDLFPAFLLAAIPLVGIWLLPGLEKPSGAHDDAAAPAVPAAIGHPSFLSPHFKPIVLHRDHLFVVNTPADTVDVIDTKTGSFLKRIPVGIDPVSIAIRPDGREAWISNHISDSVSIIDTEPASPSYLHVIGTVQDVDLEQRATNFDEPVGIAFADSQKAYVALSSENKIAVIDVASRKVTKHLTIPAQDPRAITVRNGKLYVLPFESNNKTQLSGGFKIDGDLVTFDAHQHSIAHNNVLSLGHVLDIVKHPDVPDKDLFVFDTETDRLIETVDTLGTLLYGLTVDSKGTVFIAQTDARNDANGRSGTKKHGLAELQNRAFLNQITQVDFQKNAAKKPRFIDLEPLPSEKVIPTHPFATPFAVEISTDDKTLVATAAGSNKLFTVDAASGKVLGQVMVKSVPRGIVLRSNENGTPAQAWVFNAVDNSVSLVDLTDLKRPILKSTIPLDDPTPAPFKRGRIAFNNAYVSSSATFSCASCHPDGHTDQLLWVLETPHVSGGDQIQPRSTMPLRGLRDTAPFHWDGIPGDPYGGNNSANVSAHLPPNVDGTQAEDALRQVVDGALATTMKLGEGSDDSLSRLDRNERYYMTRFLLGVPYPPAPKRAYSNALSDRAKDGFELFHLKGNHEGKPQPNVCGDCHRMPFLVSTNTPGTGMDAPTWRGAYDRFLILPQGRLNIIDFDFYRDFAEKGIPERDLWRLSWFRKPRFDPVWEMVLEGSTGSSGSFARQLTLNQKTADAPLTHDLLPALEISAREGAVVLQVDALLLDQNPPATLTLQFQKDRYIQVDGDRHGFTRAELLKLAEKGNLIATFTARHGARAGFPGPQPALWTLSPLHEQSGRQHFPILADGKKTMTLSARHVTEGAHVIINGRRVPATIRQSEAETISIELETLPPIGLHFLQVQNTTGIFSNDFIFHVANKAEDIARSSPRNPDQLRNLLERSIASGSVARVNHHLELGAPINRQHPENGMTPLSSAAFHGHPKIIDLLLEQNAELGKTNRDGNTPLHLAAFMCRTEIVEILLKNGASITTRNHRRESPLDVVTGEWSKPLADLYQFLITSSHLDLDLRHLKKHRSKIASLLRKHPGE
jgi:YVTN family beta-propeller protein